MNRAEAVRKRLMMSTATRGRPNHAACNICDRRDQLRRGLCHACYERQRRRGLIESLVSSVPARQHIALLIAGGWHYREIARAADVDPSLIHRLRKTRDKINVKTSAAICAISIADLEHSQRSGQCADPKARAAKTWATRRAKKAKAQQIADRQRVILSRAEQRVRQEVIMAQRRHTALHQREVAHPNGLLLGMPTGSWLDEALCAQVDPDIFFPDKGGSTREPKKVCLGCPVRQRCLDWALDHDEAFGIWGGKSERERHRMKHPLDKLA